MCRPHPKTYGFTIAQLGKKPQGYLKSNWGRNKLTDSVINSMQNFYGIAIRRNTDVYLMRKAVGAILFHCTKYDDNEFRHRFCPCSEDTWCKYQYGKLKNLPNNHKIHINLPIAIGNLLKPTFMRQYLQKLGSQLTEELDMSDEN